MKNADIYVSELSVSRHLFERYHFCRGNSNKRKSRLGVVLQGCGSYIYLGRRLSVSEGDVVFIPENVFCYSEWHGDPKIEVVYVSCFIHYDNFTYLPQVIVCEEQTKQALLRIGDILSSEEGDALEAYALFYRVLQEVLPRAVRSEVVFDKTLAAAVEYITGNWDRDISIAELAKKCCVSESTLYHLFKRELGQTPIGFLHSVRINVAIEYLENSNYSVSMISQTVGFRSENHFRRIFAELTGTTPLKYRRGK